MQNINHTQITTLLRQHTTLRAQKNKTKKHLFLKITLQYQKQDTNTAHTNLTRIYPFPIDPHPQGPPHRQNREKPVDCD